MKKNLQTVSDYIAAGAKYYEIKQKTLDTTRGITGFEEEKFGQSTKNLLETRSGINTAQKDEFNFKKTLVDFMANTQIDASVLKVGNRADVFRKEEADRIRREKNLSSDQQLSDRDLADIEGKAKEIKFQDEQAALKKRLMDLKI